MKKSRFSEEQIVGILKEQQAGLPVAEICRRHGSWGMVGRHAVAQAAHADHRRPGEQDGEDRLGLDGPWRLLQSSGHGVIATA